MTTYALTSLAKQELSDIWQYIARDSLSAADRVEEAIHRTCEFIAEHPGLGRERWSARHPGVLFFTVTDFPNYSVAYYSNTKPLQIVGVVHGARSLRKRFR